MARGPYTKYRATGHRDKEKVMHELILYKTDIKSNDLWLYILESVGIESHGTFAGKVLDKNIESITIKVQSAAELR